MANRFLAIGLLLVTVVLQSCDSTINMDEPFEKYFVKYLGRTGFQTGVDLAVDAENNIYVVGSTSATGDGVRNVYVAKTNPKGEILWSRILPSTGDEEGRDVEVTSDGNIILVTNRNAGGEQDFVVYVLSGSDGAFIRTPRVGGVAGLPDFANSVTETADGYVVTTYTQRSNYKEANVMRYDKDLLQFPSSWKTTFDFQTTAGGFDLVPVKVLQPDANTFYTFCYTNSAGTDNIPDYNYFVFVTGQQNNLINNFTIPGPSANSNEVLTAVQRAPVSSGGGFVLVGYINDTGSSIQDLYVVRLVQDLNAVLPSVPGTFLAMDPKRITTDLSVVSGARASVFSSTRSGFLILGQQTNQGSEDIYLTKVDNNLNSAFTGRTFGGIGADQPGAVVETADGRILFCGTMVLGEVNGQKKIALVKVSPEGLLGE